eukprot:8474954-Alexandrium_andersonii.AAC.1
MDANSASKSMWLMRLATGRQCKHGPKNSCGKRVNECECHRALANRRLGQCTRPLPDSACGWAGIQNTK